MITEILFQSPIGILTIATLLGIVVFLGWVGYVVVHNVREAGKNK
ncbi:MULTISPECIES: hypothetical protein [unclassified Thioalkalivibrio]|nr:MULTISPECIES: hypothetical protein [unclassified Thioalkalivibrio]PYG01538.1 hypothetical protein D893_01904 [Thioalkalivibrio sp. ALE21]